jgi:plastocyanin
METSPKPSEAPKSKSSPVKLIAIVVVILIVVGVAAYILTIPPVSTTANILIKDDGTCAASPPAAACLFSPASYNATVNGPAVVWKNVGGAPHTATSNSTANGSLPSFSSNTIGQNGGTYSYTFTKAGTYYYYCNIHLWMKGIVYAK